MRKRQTVEEILASGNALHLSAAEIERRRRLEAIEDERSRGLAPVGAPPRPKGLTRGQRAAWDRFCEKHAPVLRTADGDRVLAYVNARIEKRKDEAAQIEAEFTARTIPATYVAPVKAPTAPPVAKVLSKNCADEASRYAHALINGDIVSGKLAKLAAKRYIAFLSRSDIRFDAAAAQRPVDFLTRLGLELFHWQYFMLAAIFGFYSLDGTRLTHVAYTELAKKSGKSTFLAALALYMGSPANIGGDGEPRAECYLAATNRRQAAEICFRESLRLRAIDPDLASSSTAYKTSIVWADSHAKFEPCAANSERLNGMNIHLGILDELGDHPSAELWNVFQSSTVARKQPLTIGLTTAGAQRDGNVAWMTREHGIQVLEGVVQDDSFFVFICAPDMDGANPDRWDDESTWIKSNPSLDDTRLKSLREMAARAISIPSSKASFLRYNLNIWPSQLSADAWINVDDLRKEGVAYLAGEQNLSPADRIARAEERLKGRKCFGGLDLALTSDLTALALVFPPKQESGMFEVLFRFWCPEADIVARSEQHRVPYRAWVDGKFITPTAGDCTDYYHVQKDILELRRKFRIIELGFDIALATDLVQRLRHYGMPVTKVAQGFELSPVIQRVESLLRQGKLCLHGHPVANWCFANSCIFHGLKGDVRLDKQRSREKIDGAVAVCDSFHRLFLSPNLFLGAGGARISSFESGKV